ncbi:hypothetical protein [Methylobacterium gnaphalii]|uniref:hypothetical protein n=2 Tax=Methylobacterium gnaphalii TaxID=1010610 RepID=UPI0011BD7E45|nr:hypothetical protein [Methylobacterium gnaphalii]
MLYLPSSSFVRLDAYAPMLLPQAEQHRLAETFRARVNVGPRAAHARTLHPDLEGAKGKVSLMRVTGNAGEERWETRVVTVGELATSDALLWATHISMQRFYGARGSTSLVQLRSLIADADCHDQAAFRGLSPEEMAGILIERLRAAGKPLPSYVLFSGRGLHLVWVHQPLMATPGITRRHRSVQRHMHGPKGGVPSATVRTASGTRLQDPEVIAHEERMAAVWRGTGLDRGASDTARVLRLAGSYNAKSGQVARLVWPASWTDVVEHDFEDLATSFLPYTREQMAAIKAERDASWRQREAVRQERRAEQEAAGITLVEEQTRRRISGGYWASVVDALDAIRVWWGGTPPEGKRELWGFLSACAIAQAEGGDAATWASRLCRPAGLTEGELRTSLGALDRQLRRHENGETRDHDGTERSVIYEYSKARMLSLLGLSEDDARAAGAGALLPGGVARSERERSASRRAEAGVQPRAVTVSARLADGREALAMQAVGKAMREIVAAFGGRRGETSLRRAMAEAAAEPLAETLPETVVAAPVEPVSEARGEQSVSAPHGSTATIVAMPGALPPLGAETAPEPFHHPLLDLPEGDFDAPILSRHLAAPYSASTIRMNADTTPSSRAPFPAFPVPRSGADPLPNAPVSDAGRVPVPAFLLRSARVSGGRASP